MLFAAGILTHSWEQRYLELVSFACVGSLGIAFVCRRRRILFVALILIEFFLLGWLCAHSRWLFANDHIYFKKQKTVLSQMSLRGLVDSDIRRTNRLSFVLNVRASTTKEGWQRTTGKVLVNLFQDIPLNYGDEIILTGKLHRPFEFSKNKKFSYRKYLKRQGIYYVLSVKKNSEVEICHTRRGHPFLMTLYEWRGKASAIIGKQLNLSEASLIQAMILGERLRIPEFLKDVFAKTGTTHILAISGLNVGIVVAVLFLLLRMIPGPRVMTYSLTMIFIVLYVVLTGASPSVVRAGIMSVVFLTSFVIEHESDSINSLAFAAFLLLVIDPQNIFDIGFQLSFVSVLAILLFYPLFMSFLKSFLKKYPQKVMKFFIESFVVSLSATLGVVGLITYYFEIVTPISLLANLFVVPLSTLSTILGIGMLLSGGLIPFFAICIEFVLNLMVFVMALCEKVPFAYFYLKDVNIWSVVSYYFFVAFFWVWMEEIRQKVNPDAN